ncbi:MarR family winged helix-turn-helix transcriptional regulator [Spongisporangium articulatum]|uniref:MarR family winged helix-turn-helix transcriptional regulator n=1 Tax=Spongisporangium articulatum TaxID=3362603 RepID=A0ABW8AJJ7_9ACTN
MQEESVAADPLALEQQLCFGIVTAARSVVAFYRPFLEPMGLTHPQYLVMLALWQHGLLSVRELSDLLMLEPATVSPLVKRLEAAGYVTRERHAGDARLLQVRLTDAGRALRAQAEQVPLSIMQELQLDVAELASVRDSLTRLVAAMNRRSASLPGSAE